MATVTEVSAYIDENILHSELWDSAPEKRQVKAVNNAIKVLHSFLSFMFPEEADVPVHSVASQAIWMLKIDDSFQRAEMGVQQMTVDGVTILFRDRDNTLAPSVSNEYGLNLVNGRKRRTASYRVGRDDTYRIPIDNSMKQAWERL